ncbi:ComF family protein [Anthocerotibacter panamensis]|uniref:ComF family protein n=1 Tax=Anthocerotibacter panamensis TaxID=2857077 RepID=UPI001C4028A7|nr:ComF family protein [Anthocerotibacter panamensis]
MPLPATLPNSSIIRKQFSILWRLTGNACVGDHAEATTGITEFQAQDKDSKEDHAQPEKLPMPSILLDQLNPLKWLAPLTCVSCTRRAEQRLCTRCRQGLTHWQRAQGLVARVPLRVWAWGAYTGEVERALYQLKYDRAYEWGGIFGEIIAAWWQDLPERQSEYTPWHVVPIPLSQERLQTRGYNQAEEISNTFARWVRYPHLPHWLERVRATQAQFSLNPQERAANIQGAFRARPVVRGRDILLVDDIYTTGATLREAARMLTEAGARQVAALVVARPLGQT